MIGENGGQKMFWKKKNDTMDLGGYSKLIIQLSELFGQIKKLEASYTYLETQVANLRGQFNRKLSSFKNEEQEETEKDIYDDGLDIFRV